MPDANKWNVLEQKIDTQLEHTTSELHQIAEIYKRLGMIDQASEIETIVAGQKKVVPVSFRRSSKLSRQAS